MVNDQVVTKAGHAVPKNANVRILAEDPKFVCRAGFKLEKALDHFAIDVTGLTALDAGLSTGGFTDCLLQRGARHVSRCVARLEAAQAGAAVSLLLAV
jgi:23S rRNA (cytidine1920-2'-O)/16S rRNA (cytidine1409-2'-O)-methyltransferase